MSWVYVPASAASIGLGLAVPGTRPACHVERDPFCVSVLVGRMRDGVLPGAPVWDDIATFDGRPWRGKVDCVCAGYPCSHSLPQATGVAKKTPAPVAPRLPHPPRIHPDDMLLRERTQPSTSGLHAGPR